MTRCYAEVIGDPIAHSKSPLIHNFWLGKLGIDAEYRAARVRPEELADYFMRKRDDPAWRGCNVTIPHKETVLALADVVTDRAALIGAANTLIFRKDGRLHADNTDGYGFIANLRQNAPAWNPEAGPAAVIGAGGAARAVIASLIEVGAPEIRLANRTRARAEALRAEFGAKVIVSEWVQAGNMLDGATTVVNTSSLGMEGKPEFRVPLDALSPRAVVTDLVYTPLRTRFLDDAAANGCLTVDGLGMLLHQAAPAFERWFGIRPEVDDATRAAIIGE